MAKTAIITGITGQDGAYLSQFLLDKNYKVIGLVRRDADENLFGLRYLNIYEKITIEKCSLLDLKDITGVFAKYKPDEVYNLAAQSSVGQSFQQPFDTINFNIFSVLNLLEAIKNSDDQIRFYQASSSEMYGNISHLPVTEDSVIHPTSPYGISKAAGHWMTVNYRESYGLFACCGILFNHESYLRTPNFYVKKIIQAAINIKNKVQKELRIGNIDLNRDFGFGPDYVKAMWLILQQEQPRDYLVCSGSSVSLRDIVNYVFTSLDVSKESIIIDHSLYRPNEIKNIYGTNIRAKNELGWDYNKSFFEVLDMLIKEELKNQ